MNSPGDLGLCDTATTDWWYDEGSLTLYTVQNTQTYYLTLTGNKAGISTTNPAIKDGKILLSSAPQDANVMLSDKLNKSIIKMKNR